MTNYMKRRYNEIHACKVCNSNCLQSGPVEMAVKTDSIEFLSTNNGSDGCVLVACTHCQHIDGVDRGLMTLLRQDPEDSSRK